MKKTFILKYNVTLMNGEKLLNKEIRAKKCLSKLQAKVQLENYLIKKYNKY